MDDTNYDLNKSISRLESESQKELGEFAYEPEQTLINSIHVDQVSNLSETEKNEAKDEQEQAEDEEPRSHRLRLGRGVYSGAHPCGSRGGQPRACQEASRRRGSRPL